jgi:glycine/D-amino acid oxidase-like deaminating enzyme
VRLAAGRAFPEEREQVRVVPGDVEDVGRGREAAANGGRVEETVEKVVHRLPVTETARIAAGRTDLRPLTRDGHASLGWASGVVSAFVALGFGGDGVSRAPAMGRHVAEGLRAGRPPRDLSLSGSARVAPGATGAREAGPDAE